MTFHASYIYDFEIFQLQPRAQRERKSDWWILPIMYISLALVGALSIVTQKKPPSGTEIAFELLGTPLVAALAGYFIVWRILSPRIGFRNCSVSGKRLNFSIFDDGVSFVRDDGVKEFWPWTSIKDFTQLKDGKAAVLWIVTNAGFVLPSEAFAPVEEYKAACRFIEGRIRHARSNPAVAE
ncbi:MAG: hypothetical protein JNL45_04300 [Hyphomicrobium sp.]|nr:hypothetical protein [Hyphomicrobium sp.]